MKINELRIGNYVNIEGDVVKVKEIYEKSIHYTYGEYESYATEDFIQPIELTEYILESLFGKPRTNGNKFDIYYIPTNGIEIQDRRKSALPTPTICIVKFGVHICNIKYLHQLQNAYYLLTCKELEVKL